jgi:hypothetical protein
MLGVVVVVVGGVGVVVGWGVGVVVGVVGVVVVGVVVMVVVVEEEETEKTPCNANLPSTHSIKSCWHSNMTNATFMWLIRFNMSLCKLIGHFSCLKQPSNMPSNTSFFILYCGDMHMAVKVSRVS